MSLGIAHIKNILVTEWFVVRSLGAGILYMSNSKTRLWLVFTLFSLFLLAEHFVQFGMPIGKLA